MDNNSDSPNLMRNPFHPDNTNEYYNAQVDENGNEIPMPDNWHKQDILNRFKSPKLLTEQAQKLLGLPDEVVNPTQAQSQENTQSQENSITSQDTPQDFASKMLYALKVQDKQRRLETSRREKFMRLSVKANESRTLGEHIKDHSISGLKGANQVVSGAYQFANFISQLNSSQIGRINRALGYEGRANPPTLDEMTGMLSESGKTLGQWLSETNVLADDMQSDVLKAQRELNQVKKDYRNTKKEEEREGKDSVADNIGYFIEDFSDSVRDLAGAPAIVADAAISSFMHFLVPGAAGGTLAKNMSKEVTERSIKKYGKDKGKEMAEKVISSKHYQNTLTKAQKKIGVGYTGIAEGGSNALEAQNEILNMDDEELKELPMYKALLGDNLTHEEIKRTLANRHAMTTFIGAGTLGAVTSKVSGAGKREGAGFKPNSLMNKSGTVRFAKDIGKETLEESIQEGGGQLSQNISSRLNLDPKQKLMEDVAEGTAAGFVTGPVATGPISATRNLGKVSSNAVDNIKAAGKKTKEFADEAYKRSEDRLKESDSKDNTEDSTDVNSKKTFKDRVLDKAAKSVANVREKQTGVTQLARKAIVTGKQKDIDKVLEKDADGNYKDPISAVGYLAENTKEKPREEELLEANAAANELLKIKDSGQLEKMSKKEREQYNKLVNITRAKIDKVLSKDREDASSLISELSDGGLSKDSKDIKGNADRARRAGNIFKNEDFNSPKDAEEVASKIDTLLESGLLSEETDADLVSELKATRNIAKNIKQVHKDFLTSTNPDKPGLNIYRKMAKSQLKANDVTGAEKTLTQLDTFKSKHKSKAKEFQEAFNAWETLNGENARTLSNSKRKALEAKIAKVEKRTTDGGENYKVGNDFNSVVQQVKTEANLLDSLSTEIQASINARKNAATAKQASSEAFTEETDTNTPQSNSDPLKGSTEAAGSSTTNQDNNTEVKSTTETVSPDSPVDEVKPKKSQVTEPISPEVTDEAEQATEQVNEPVTESTTPEVINNKTNQSPLSKTRGNVSEIVQQLKSSLIARSHNSVYRKEANKLMTDLVNYSKSIGNKVDKAIQKNIKEGKYWTGGELTKDLFSLVEDIKNREAILDAQNKLSKALKPEVRAVLRARGIDITKEHIQMVKEGKLENVNKIKALFKKINNVFTFKDYNLTNELMEKSTRLEEHANKKTNTIYQHATNAISGLSEYFKHSKRKQENNIFLETPNAIEVLREIYQDKSNRLEPEEREGLKKFLEFHDKFVDTFVNNFVGKDSKFIYQDAASIFLKEGYDPKNVTKDDFDPNFLSVMAISSINWLKNYGNGTTINLDTDINALLQRDSNSSTTPYEVATLREVGTLQSDVNQAIAGNILKQLGLESRDDIPGPLEQKIEDSLGHNAIAVMQSMGLIELNLVNNFVHQSLIEKVSPENIIKELNANKDDKNGYKGKYGATRNFIRVKTQKDEDTGLVKMEEGEGKVNDYVENYKKVTESLNEFFDTGTEFIPPLFDEPKNVKRKVRKSTQKPSKETNRILDKVNKRPYVLNNPMVELVAKLGDKAVKTIMGFQENYQDKHITEQVAIEGKNNGIEREINQFNMFKERVSSPDTKFYFVDDLVSSTRMSPRQNLVNVQAYKYHRSMVSLESNIETITIDGTPESNQAQSNFLRGVAASLGIKTNNKSDKEVKELLNSKINNSIYIKDALKVINKKELTEEDSNLIIEAVKEGGEDMHSLEGLKAYADYQQLIVKEGYLKEKDSDYMLSFKTTIYREADGTNNGLAINLLQIVPNIFQAIKGLKRVGIFKTKADRDRTIQGRPEDMDTYIHIAREWTNELLELDKTYQGNEDMEALLEKLKEFGGSLVDTDGAVTVDGRKLAKPVVMTTEYQAGLKANVQNFVDGKLKKFYKDITETALEMSKYRKTDKELSEQFYNKAISLLTQINTLTGNQSNGLRGILGKLSAESNTDKGLTQETKNKLLNWELNREGKTILFNTVFDYYGKALGEVLKREQEDRKEIVAQATKAMTNAFNIFNAKYEKRIKDFLDSHGGMYPNRKQVAQINEEMLNEFPSFRTYFSEDKSTNLLTLKQKYIAAEPNSKNKGTSRTETAFKTPMEFNYIDPINPKNKLTRTRKQLYSLVQRPSWFNKHLSATITGVHGIDAAAMLKSLETALAINIHDAHISSTQNADENSQILNKSFFEVNKDYSLLGAILEMYEESVKGLPENKYSKIQAHLVEFRNVVATNNGNRQALFNLLGYIDQYTDGGNTAYTVEGKVKTVNPENTNTENTNTENTNTENTNKNNETEIDEREIFDNTTRGNLVALIGRFLKPKLNEIRSSDKITDAGKRNIALLAGALNIVSDIINRMDADNNLTVNEIIDNNNYDFKHLSFIAANIEAVNKAYIKVNEEEGKGHDESLGEALKSPEALKEGLKHIQSHDKYTKAHKRFAALLDKLVEGSNTKVIIYDGSTNKDLPNHLRAVMERVTPQGYYWEDGKDGGDSYIILNDFKMFSGVNPETFLHEIGHAVTKKLLHGRVKLTPKQQKAKDGLEKLRQDLIKKDKANEFGYQLSNVDELISYGWTSPTFQEFLKSVERDGETNWNRLVKYVADLFGLNKQDHNALSELMSLTSDLVLVEDVLTDTQQDIKQENNNQSEADNLIKEINEGLDKEVADTIVNLINETIIEEREQAKKDEDKFKSDSEGFTSDPDARKERTITNMTAEDIYNELGKDDSILDSEEQDNYLKTILRDIVGKTEKEIKLFYDEQNSKNQGYYDPEKDEIVMSVAPTSEVATISTRMSKKEVYMHELLHALSHALIDGFTPAARELKRFYKQVKDAKNPDGTKWLTYKDFIDPRLDKNSMSKEDYKEEVQIAKRMYDYIFGKDVESFDKIAYNPITGRNEAVRVYKGYHEFFAIALTNEALRSKLSRFEKETGKPKEQNQGLFERFRNWVSTLIQRLADRKLYGPTSHRNNSMDKKMFILATYLTGVKQNEKSILWDTLNEGQEIINKSLEKLIKLALKPFVTFANSEFAKQSKNVYVGLTSAAINNAKRLDSLVDVMQAVKDVGNNTKDTLIASILQEMRGVTEKNSYLYKLNRLRQNFIDRKRMQFKDVTKTYIKESFLTPLTKEENDDAVYLIMADVDGLFDRVEDKLDYTTYNLSKLYDKDNKTYLNKQIGNKIKQLKKEFNSKHPGLTNLYRNLAEDMGKRMVLGTGTIRHSSRNTRNAALIAVRDGGLKLSKQEIDTATEIINKLATLYAIQYTPNNVKDNIKTIVDREFGSNPGENGITKTLGFHKQNKEFALKAVFEGSENLMEKGYTKESFNEHKTYVTAPKSLEADLKKQGFTLQAKLDKDITMKGEEDMYIYVANKRNMGQWISGIVSMTGTQAAGTKLYDIINNGKNEYGNIDNPANVGRLTHQKRKAIIAYRKKVVKAMLDTNPSNYNKNAAIYKLRDGEGSMEPIYNNKGEIVDFRYRIQESAKRTYLKKNYSLTNTLGDMQSNILDKKNSRILNKKLIHELKKTFDNATDSELKGYVYIGEDSLNEDDKELYRQLPDSFKEDLKNIWGQHGIHVRREDKRFIFGERELMLSNLKYKNPGNDIYSIEWLSAQVNNIAAFLLNNRHFKYMEMVWKEAIGMAKDAIVIKSGVVLLANVISNTILLRTMGVPVRDIISSHAEAFKALREHKTDTNRLNKLRMESNMDNVMAMRNKREIEELTSKLSTNPVNALIEEGLYQHIVEDVDLYEEDNTTEIERIVKNNKVVKGITEMMPSAVRKAGKQLFSTHDTGIYQFMRDATQASDFIARYTLHKHNMSQKKMTYEKSINLISQTFVEYSSPTHKYIQYLNDVGLFMFSKFLFRIQGTLLYLAKNRPGALASLAIGQTLSGIDVSDIGDSFIGFGLGRNTNNPLEVALQTVTAPMFVDGLMDAVDL